MMKKLLLIITVIASFSFMNAQENSVRFGVKAGLNIANIVGDSQDLWDDLNGEIKPIIRFHVGALVEIPVSEVFAIQPELLFSRQGAKLKIDNAEEISNLSYLNIPLIAKFYLAEGLSFQVGPQIGFLLSAKNKASGTFFDGFETVTVDEESDIKDRVNSVDFGLNFGFGYQLEQGVFFDARYSLGLSNINDFEGSDDFEDSNSVFQISLGYKF